MPAPAGQVSQNLKKSFVMILQNAELCNSWLHEAVDVDSYCEWGVDYLKLDACSGRGYAQVSVFQSKKFCVQIGSNWVKNICKS